MSWKETIMKTVIGGQFAANTYMYYKLQTSRLDKDTTVDTNRWLDVHISDLVNNWLTEKEHIDWEKEHCNCFDYTKYRKPKSEDSN